VRGSLWIVLVGLGGCFTKPDPPAGVVDAPVIDASDVDASVDASTACARYTFDSGGDACAPWGHGVGNADSESIGGNLVITPLPNDGNDGGCVGNAMVPFTERGMVIEVIQVVSAPSGYTRFTLDDEDKYPRMEHSNGTLKIRTLSQTPAMVNYVAADMRWWKLRLDRPRQRIIGEYSADGMTWVTLGELGSPPALARPQIEAGVQSAEPTPGTTVVGEFQLCPP